VILALLISGADAVEKIKGRLSLDELKDSSIRDIADVVYGLHKANVEVSPASLISHMGNKQDVAVLVSEAVNILDILSDKDKAIEDCVARIKKDNVKDCLVRMQESIRLAHSQHDEEKVRQLVSEYSSLVKAKI
jgi:hypothetical protein